MDNQLDRKIAELEDLVNLAEKVSNNIDDLAKNRSSILFTLILSVFAFTALLILSYNIKQDENLSLILKVGTLLSALFLGFSLYNFRNYSYINNKIKRESKILRKLLNMIYPFQESFSKDDIGIMRKAIFDMKLSRIKFSNIEDPKPNHQKEQPTPQPKEPVTTT